MRKSDCRHLRSPGDAIVLELTPPFDDQAEQHLALGAAGLFRELAPVAEPIAADLILTCRPEDEPFLERDTIPSPRFFYLREAEPPAHIGTLIEATVDPRLLVTSVPQLDATTIARWIAQAIAQSAAPPGFAVTLDVLRVGFSRARLYSVKGAGEDVFRVRWHDDTVEIPMEWRNATPWVSGPVGWVNMIAPVAFEIINHDGALRATVWPGWSFWAERNHPEHDALEQALRRLVAGGWTPQLVPLAFDLGAGAVAGGADR